MPKRPDDRALQQLRGLITEANKAYRSGSPILSDAEYDVLVEKLETLNPSDALLQAVGANVVTGRKCALFAPMASMNKVKTVDELNAWLLSKGMPYNAELIVMPKYDGVSGLVNERSKEAYTRGDGRVGQDIADHYGVCCGYIDKALPLKVVGEFIISKAAFTTRYATTFKNGRNMVSGLVNKEDASEPMYYTDYIRYGLAQGEACAYGTKAELLDYLNTLQPVAVPYMIFKADELNEVELFDLFEEWAQEYELDGLIVEVNSMAVQYRLGTETNGNPAYARAYKGSFEQLATTTVEQVNWDISKQGYYKPVIQISPVNLDGVLVTNITGNNARYIQTLGIGKGAVVTVKRSGMVIPQIVAVDKPTTREDLPTECYHCGHDLEWNDNEVELLCTYSECDGVAFKKALSFFIHMGVENMKEGVLRQLWDNGLDSLSSILSATVVDLEDIDGFGRSKATKIHKSIHEKMVSVSMAQLMHASGCFHGLGSTKLAAVCELTADATREDIVKVDGFSDKSADIYLKGLAEFWPFYDSLPVQIGIAGGDAVNVVSDDFTGMRFCFTGFRNHDWEKEIKSRGGVYSDSLTKQTTHLVMKVKGSGSGKEAKALKYGAIILDWDEFKRMIM
jgi:DNA ligase (NAD+)